MSAEIPLRLLKLRATVTRLNTTSDEYENVISNLPCRLAWHKDAENTQGYARSSETEFALFFCNHEFNGDLVDIRYEDRIVIGTETYRALNMHDSESHSHHLEGDVEHLKKLSTIP